MMSLDGWSLQNLELSRSGELVVRRALLTESGVPLPVFGTNLGLSPGTFVAGWSLRSQNTGEVTHYLVVRHRDGRGELYLYRESFAGFELGSVPLGILPERTFVTCATLASPHTSSLEILIGGPDIRTHYGFVGGGVVVAEKVEDEDPDTDALDIPRGIVGSVAGRAVIASGKNLFFSNAYGTAIVDGPEGVFEAVFTGPRTYSAVNIGDMAAAIYGLHTSDAGDLYVVTDRGVWALPPVALSQGLAVVDLFRKVSDYNATGYGQTAFSRGILYGLTSKGVARLSDGTEISLDENRYSRALALPMEVSDYRQCQLLATDRGVAVSHRRGIFLLDELSQHRTWITAPSRDMRAAGILREREGHEIFVLPNALASLYGTNEAVTGIAAGLLQAPPQASLVVREVTTSSDSAGNQSAAVRGGSVRVKPTPQQGAIIGTDTWSSTEPFGEKALRSRRHRFAVRTDDPTVEIAAEHPGSRLGMIDVAFGGQGRRRP
jgi:hypothetical protein